MIPQQCEPGRNRVRIDHLGEIGIEIMGLKAREEEIRDKKMQERKIEQMKRQEILPLPPGKRQCSADIRKYLSLTMNRISKKLLARS